jgi:hypothetical protein
VELIFQTMPSNSVASAWSDSKLNEVTMPAEAAISSDVLC